MTATPEYVDRRLAERGQPTGGITGQVLAKANDGDYSATWQDTASTIVDGTITTAKIADDAVTPAKIAQGTAGQILHTNATPDTAWVTVTGDVTISSAGATTIANNAVTTAKIGNDQVTTAKIGNDQVTTAKIGNDQITTAKIANDQVTTAKIAQGTAGQILHTNATPDTAWVTVTGDVTISSAGATTIGAGTVTAAKLATTTGEPAGVWNSDTVTSGFTNVTGGNASRRWLIIGKTMKFRIWFTAGTATAASFVEVPLPASASMQTARATFYNAANGSTLVTSFTPTASPTLVRITNSTAAGNFTAGATLVNVQVNGTLEIA